MLPNLWPPVCHLKARRTRTASRLKGKEAVHKVRDILNQRSIPGERRLGEVELGVLGSGAMWKGCQWDIQCGDVGQWGGIGVGASMGLVTTNGMWVGARLGLGIQVESMDNQGAMAIGAVGSVATCKTRLLSRANSKM